MKVRLLIILIIPFLFLEGHLQAQTKVNTERTIYLMRAKQFYGSGAKMNLMINGILFYKLKSGRRLILNSDTNDTLNIQIISPLMKKQKSKVLTIVPGNENEIYIDLFYWGEGYNPLKHAGVLNPVGGTPEFNIEIIQMSSEEGKIKFNQSKLYKDNKKIAEKKWGE